MMQAMIFAAGLGTRLKPLTDRIPKALVSVGGEPLLKRVIFRLKDAGFARIVVNVHHFSSLIIDYLRDNDNFGMDIRISDETDKLLETGGGIRKAWPLFDANEPVLIHNVDILSNVDLGKFYQIETKDLTEESQEASPEEKPLHLACLDVRPPHQPHTVIEEKITFCLAFAHQQAGCKRLFLR